jgi:HSP20 family protein
VEVYEQNNEFFVKAELPGLKKQDVNVEVAAGALTISGERREEVEKSESGFYRSERSYGGFLRTIALPAGATIEKAVATMKDGVLEIKMPLANTIETPRRKIDIAEAAPDGNDASNAA